MGQGVSTVTDVATYNCQVVCLRIPADGSSPHLVNLPAVSNYDGNHDSYLMQLPDFRLYWRSEERWKFRTFGVMHIRKQENQALDGLYYMYKSFAMDNAPLNKHLQSSSRGDAFIVKLESEYGEASRAVYADIPAELPGSALLDLMLEAMSARGTNFWTINYDDGVFDYSEPPRTLHSNKEKLVVRRPYLARKIEKTNDKKHILFVKESVTKLHAQCTMYHSKAIQKSPRHI